MLLPDSRFSTIFRTHYTNLFRKSLSPVHDVQNSQLEISVRNNAINSHYTITGFATYHAIFLPPKRVAVTPDPVRMQVVCRCPYIYIHFIWSRDGCNKFTCNLLYTRLERRRPVTWIQHLLAHVMYFACFTVRSTSTGRLRFKRLTGQLENNFLSWKTIDSTELDADRPWGVTRTVRRYYIRCFMYTRACCAIVWTMCVTLLCKKLVFRFKRPNDSHMRPTSWCDGDRLGDSPWSLLQTDIPNFSSFINMCYYNLKFENFEHLQSNLRGVIWLTFFFLNMLCVIKKTT